MRHAAVGFALVTIAVTSCRTDRITTADPVVAAATDVWSGATVVLSSASFVGADSLPVVTLGAETLAVRVAGPDSVAAQLPDTDGLLTLKVGLRAGGRALIQVLAHGLTAAGELPGLGGTSLYPWPGNGNPTALAFVAGRLVLADLRTGTTSLPLAPDTALGSCYVNDLPVPAADDRRLVTVAQRPNCLLLAIPGTPQAPAPDTGPPLGAYSAVHLAQGRWLVSMKGDTLAVYTRSAGGFVRTPVWSQWGYGGGFTISPRGDRILPTQHYAGLAGAEGVPLIDVDSGSVRAVVPLTVSVAADFTPGGDTLFVTGDSADEHLLLAVDAATGVTLARLALPAPGVSVIVDPAGPWVYTALAPVGGPQVVVVDRATLGLVATLRPSAALAGSLTGTWEAFPATLLAGISPRELYLVFGTLPAASVFRYGLMP